MCCLKCCPVFSQFSHLVIFTNCHVSVTALNFHIVRLQALPSSLSSTLHHTLKIFYAFVVFYFFILPHVACYLCYHYVFHLYQDVFSSIEKYWWCNLLYVVHFAVHKEYKWMHNGDVTCVHFAFSNMECIWRSIKKSNF